MSEQNGPDDRRAPRVQVVIDTADPHAQAEFWAAALGYEVEDVSGVVRWALDAGHATQADVMERAGALVWRDAAAARDPAGEGPRLFLQRVPEPKSVKNRVHLDLHVGPERVASEVERLLGLGATTLYDGQLGPQTWVTLADPEGNELCVS